MSHNKHILIIPSWYPKNSGDINGSFFREQAIALRKAGYKVGVIKPTVLSLKKIKSIFGKSHGILYENDSGVDTYRLHALNVTPRMPRLSRNRWVRLGEQLYSKYVREHGRPDIIHVHSLNFGGFLARAIKNKYKIPYVVTEHSTAFARNLVSQKVLKALCPVVGDSSANLAVSSEFKELLADIFKCGDWLFVPNIVSNEFFMPDLTDHKTYKDFCFINICYLTRKKNIDLLIRSFASAFKGNTSVKLKIGGDGEEKTKLVELARTLNVDQQVVFLGRLTRQQVKEEISHADAFVLSSEYETFGVVLIEALALGKPVIATKCGGPESIVTPEVGYLVENKSEKELSEAMLELIKKKDSYIAKNIRAYCLKNFSEMAVIARLAEIYESVLSENAR